LVLIKQEVQDQQVLQVQPVLQEQLVLQVQPVRLAQLVRLVLPVLPVLHLQLQDQQVLAV
jgi:hypothetical protein